MNKTDVEEYALKEVLKNCSLYERIIIRIHYKIFIKFFNEIRIDIINNSWITFTIKICF